MLRHQLKHRRQRPSNNSPFLNLPPEIRNKIYIAALVAPAPIDLCPADYAYTTEEFATSPVAQRRHSAFQKSDAAYVVGYRGHQPTALAFRRQSGLQYVRKHLAVHLLAVCRQIYNEATGYFWGRNVWRFSDDQDWEILLRFLLTIGENARAMIRNLEVLAPCAWTKSPVLNKNEYWVVKNQPELHMIKVWHERRRHKVVWELWMREKSLRTLDLIVPAGYELGPLNIWCRRRYRWCGFFPWDDLFVEFTAKTRVVYERDGVLGDLDWILQQGWDAVNHVVFFPDDAGVSWELQESWDSDADFLTGVPQLFVIEEISVHANGGRVCNAAANKKTNERVLKGFGPCMIRVDDVPCQCWQCTSRSPFNWPVPKHQRSGVRYSSLVDLRDRELLEWLGSFDI